MYVKLDCEKNIRKYIPCSILVNCTAIVVRGNDLLLEHISISFVILH
uniref:Uncharacterized protein n=1 Tax=Arundo donax TaxID=35708 RepID=A0A0A9HXQ5_ARUDO